MRRREVEAAPADTVKAVVQALGERGLKVYAVIDHRKEIEGSGSMPFTAFSILFGSASLSSMLLGKNTEISVGLPLVMAVVEKGGMSVITYRDAHSLLSDFQLVSTEDTANLVNRIMDGIVESAASYAAGNG